MMTGSVEREGTCIICIVGYGEKGFFSKRHDDLEECREICQVLKAWLVSLWGKAEKDCVSVLVVVALALWGSECGFWRILFSLLWFFKPKALNSFKF
jgi:hypothetical protein